MNSTPPTAPSASPGGNPPNPGSPDPLRVLESILDSLTTIYTEAGVPPQAARVAALADLECDFGALPLAA